MKPQATRIQPAAPANARAEVLGVLLLAFAIGAGWALLRNFPWSVLA